MTTPPNRIGLRELRTVIGRTVEQALFNNTQTIIDRYGRPAAVIVSYDWWAARQENPPTTTEKTAN